MMTAALGSSCCPSLIPAATTFVLRFHLFCFAILTLMNPSLCSCSLPLFTQPITFYISCLTFVPPAAGWAGFRFLCLRVAKLRPARATPPALHDAARPAADEDARSPGRHESANVSRCKYELKRELTKVCTVCIRNPLFLRSCVVPTATSICCVAAICIRRLCSLWLFSAAHNQMAQLLSTRCLANMTANMACNSFDGQGKKPSREQKGGRGQRKLVNHFRA